MYVQRLKITNIRSIDNFEIKFTLTESPGWHVILGANGAGKSSVVRSLALALAGPKEAAALRQDWGTWVRSGASEGAIGLDISYQDRDRFTGSGNRPSNSLVKLELALKPIESSIGGPRFDVTATSGKALADRSLWGTNSGWFSASFGPFRRFTGGDQAFERLFFSNPRLASHLSAFGEDVALTEGLRWLRDLRVKELEQSYWDKRLLNRLIKFLNESQLLPHGAEVVEVRSEEILIQDGNGSRVSVEQMSDGYRSVLSMIFEILRQMTKSYNMEETIEKINVKDGTIRLPGVVVIDEVDAHLHPSWQKDIGPWFTRCFPDVQFIVTTHSPIICRTAKTVWRLASPGSAEAAKKIEGDELERLLHGSILEAYGTEFFGHDMARSADSKQLLRDLAQLNRKALKTGLDAKEREQLERLRRILPTRATDIDAG